MGICGIYGNDDSRRLMGSPSLLAMSREFDHDESAQRGKISAGGRQLPQPLGSTPPTRRPRGSQVLRDPCNSGISFRRRNNHRPKIISKRCRPGGTTPRLPREGAVSRLRRETEGVAFGRSIPPRRRHRQYKSGQATNDRPYTPSQTQFAQNTPAILKISIMYDLLFLI